MFKFIKKEDASCKIDASYIHEAEKNINAVFPKILAKYYLEHNGAEINEISFIKNGIGFVVIELYTIKYGNQPIEEMVAINSTDEGFPAGFIPLGLDEDYDEYCWDKNTGKVYYFCRENDKNPFLIADSVDEFFELLNGNINLK